MKTIAVLARFLFASIFIMGGPGDFFAPTIAYAAGQGVPLAKIAVPLAGVMAIAGGLSVLLGYKVRYGALILVAFLLPVTFYMHAFWHVADPMMRQMQQVQFMKNIALVGSALMFYILGAGPASVDARSTEKRENAELQAQLS